VNAVERERLAHSVGQRFHSHSSVAESAITFRSGLHQLVTDICSRNSGLTWSRTISQQDPCGSDGGADAFAPLKEEHDEEVVFEDRSTSPTQPARLPSTSADSLVGFPSRVARILPRAR
jgi:hypothetical protein